MPHGAPDDSDVVKRGAAYRLDDMAELAARLGSPMTFNRQGDVVWLDTFAGGVNGWVRYTGGAGILIELENTHFLTEGLACVLTVAVADPRYAMIYRSFPYYSDTRLGFGITYACAGANSTVGLEMDYFEGAFYYKGLIRIDHTSGDVTYLDTTGGFTALGNLGLLDGVGVIWYPTKLIIDTLANEYVGFYHGDTYYNMAGIPLYTGGSALAPHSMTVVTFSDTVGSGQSLYLDSAIYTENEF